jgi:chromosome segregation ATPase
VVAERDGQLKELSEQLPGLGSELELARAVVAERDAQLRELSERLAQLGREHEHAQAVVAERDAELLQIKSHWTWRFFRGKRLTI